MTDYVYERKITIRDENGVCEVSLWDDDEVDLAELRQVVRTHVMPHMGGAGYRLEDRYLVAEMGASSAIQEVILTILDGTAAGVTAAMVQSLISWIGSRKRSDGPKAVVQDPGKLATGFVRTHFGQSGKLALRRIRKTATGNEIQVLGSAGARFDVHVTEEGDVLFAKKRPNAGRAA
ncbi:MAG: hypothetical protein HYZ27_08350, partial [Deltaproteobacteria bacterium]|nr:hypothetical protein [Deltaproteobacteria bacterium]